jgi:hypothetical protein
MIKPMELDQFLLRLLMVNLNQTGDLKRGSVISIAKSDMGVGLPIDILALIPLN